MRIGGFLYEQVCKSYDSRSFFNRCRRSCKCYMRDFFYQNAEILPR